MASETQNGRAYIHGIRNDGSAITITGYASFTIESAKIAQKSDITTLKDELGFDNAHIATNTHYELDIQFMPSGASKSAANAVATFIDPLTAVTLAHFENDTFNGLYTFMGDSSIDLSEKQAKMSLKLRRYADATQNTALATTVS